MSTARFSDHILPPGPLADRPAAATVPVNTLYPATDEQVIYQSDGAAWAVWASRASGVLLLENGAAVPAGTPVGTLIFEKDA